MTEAEFKSQLAFLEREFGLTLARFELSERHFGNIIASYAGPGASVDVVIDRGIPEIRIFRGPRTLTFEDALSRIGTSSLFETRYRDQYDSIGSPFAPTLPEQAAGLREHLASILDYMSKPSGVA